MSSQVAGEVFRSIFPRYADLLSERTAVGSESIEVFLREELPRKVEMVRNMEGCFNAFLTHFTNVLLKRPAHSNLLHSLTLRAADKTEKYFHSLALAIHKLEGSNLRERVPALDLQQLRRDFRSRLDGLQELLREKYFGGGVERECEEEVAVRLYVLLEIHHFLKGDPVAAAAKFRLREQDVLFSVARNQPPADISSLVVLDSAFVASVEEAVSKRCRPFLNKREVLESKVREVLREGESRVGTNVSLLLEALVSKERVRIGREVGSGLGREVKEIEEGEGEAEAREMVGEMERLKREFGQLRNSTYFLDMMRGSFSEKYKMEVGRLENVFYLTNLEKYLQDVSTFLEKLLALEERLILNRRDYMRHFAAQVELKLNDLIAHFQTRNPPLTLADVLAQQFELLESALYGVPNNRPQDSQRPTDNRLQREAREQERQRMMEGKAEEERERREAERAKAEEKKRKEEERLRKVREEREEKERVMREENERLEEERKAELERKREEKSRKDEEGRRQREEEQRRKDAEKREREEQDRLKREEAMRKRAEEDDRKRREKEEELKRKEEERRNILHREEEEKRRKEAELRDRKKAEEEERARRDQDKRAEEERLRREKEQRDAEQRKREEERLRLDKEKRDRELREAEERKREDDKAKQERERREKEQREAEERKREEERQKAEKERKERERKEAEEKERKDRERREREAEEKRKEEERLRVERERREQEARDRERKAEEERIAKEKDDKKRKEEEERVRLERERQDRERKQREDRERQERERLEKERKEKERQERERADRERAEREKAEKEKADRERAERERAEREKKQREQKQADQRRKEEERQRQEKQRKQREKREAEEKARIEKEKKEKEQKQKQLRERAEKEKAEKEKAEREKAEREKAERERAEREKAAAAASKKPDSKKSSGINYGDFDDILDDDLEEMEKAGKFSPSGIKSAAQEEEEEYGDDFDEESPEKEGEIESKDLISPADVKCLNEYMKGTTYGRKNKVNAELLNKSSQYILVFEEFVQNRKLFFFDSALSKAVLDLGEELGNPDTSEDDLRMSVETIKEEMLHAYDEVLPGEELFPATRYVFPFSFRNPYGIRVLEMVPAHCYFHVVLEEALPGDEEIQSGYQGIIEALLHILELEGEPQVEEYVMNEETKLVLGTFDKEMPCLLLLFAMHYEHAFNKEVTVNQYTIERYFYTAHIIEPLYEAMKDIDQLDEFYSKLADKYAAHDKIKLQSIAVNSSDPAYEDKLAHSSIAIKQDFAKGKHSTVLANFSIEIEDESGEVSEKVVVYFSLEKASPKPVINYFIVFKDQEEQENASLIFELIGNGDEHFESNVYIDYTRHNCLSSYSDWTLPLWAHVVTKRKLSTLQAMRALTFAMTPYYLAYKEMD